MRRLGITAALLMGAAAALLQAGAEPIRARNGIVMSQNEQASRIGVEAAGRAGERARARRLSRLACVGGVVEARHATHVAVPGVDRAVLAERRPVRAV